MRNQYQKPTNMNYEVEEARGLNKAASCDYEPGQLHMSYNAYDMLLNEERNNMYRLGRLIERLEGVTPEKVNPNDKESELKNRRIHGLITELNLLNEENARVTDIISHMISKLETLI